VISFVEFRPEPIRKPVETRRIAPGFRVVEYRIATVKKRGIMKDAGGPIQISRFLNGVIAICCVALFAIGARVSTRTPQRNIQRQLEELKQNLKLEDIALTNKTSGFEVASLEKTSEGNIRIGLRNNYDKNITAYQVSLGSTTTLVETILNTFESSIHPGAVVELVEAINIDPDLSTTGLVIRAVVFDDGTADGEAKYIGEINDYRQGEMMQIKHATSLLREIAKTPDNEILRSLGKVNNTFSRSSSTDKLPQSVAFGAEDARKRMAVYVENIKAQDEGNIRSRVIKLLDYCRNKSMELSLYNERARTNSGSKALSR